jgi:hypothetical protein
VPGGFNIFLAEFNPNHKLILISKMFQPVTKIRHSGMDAGIQSQGCEAMSDTATK